MALLKASGNLDPERDELARLKEALRLNKPLAVAYYLKEDLRQFWDQPGRLRRRFLRDWMRRARASGVKMLEQMARTMESHSDGLLAYYEHPISTGPLEGIEQQVRTMSRQAYGFRTSSSSSSRSWRSTRPGTL